MCTFLVTKLLYIFNAFGQFYILNHLLFENFTSYGLNLLDNELSALDNAFPKVALCDMQIRRLGRQHYALLNDSCSRSDIIDRFTGNLHSYTLQCTLTVNLYNQKIFAFLWFWMLFIAVVNVIGFLFWCLKFIGTCDRIRFVRNHLHPLRDMSNRKSEADLKRFVCEYLQPDGTFLLRLISHNVNTISTTDITCALWDKWKESDHGNVKVTDKKTLRQFEDNFEFMDDSEKETLTSKTSSSEL